MMCYCLFYKSNVFFNVIKIAVHIFVKGACSVSIMQYTL